MGNDKSHALPSVLHHRDTVYLPWVYDSICPSLWPPYAMMTLIEWRTPDLDLVYQVLFLHTYTCRRNWENIWKQACKSNVGLLWRWLSSFDLMTPRSTVAACMPLPRGPLAPICIESNRFIRFCRAMLCIRAAYVIARCLFVRPLRSCILSKRIKPQTFFIAGYPHHSSFSVPNVMAIFWRDAPNGGAECRWVGKNRDSRPISGFRIDEWWSAINNFDGRPCSSL